MAVFEKNQDVGYDVIHSLLEKSPLKMGEAITVDLLRLVKEYCQGFSHDRWHFLGLGVIARVIVRNH